MTPQSFERARQLFVSARDVAPEQRESWIAEQCGVDLALRREVLSLISHDRSDGSDSLDAPVFNLPRIPATIGHYQILSLLGEGGMGIVYEAQQQHPRRLVALKVIRPLLVTRSLLRRFELEAEVLARLEHPGIARIYEAGTFQTDFGAQPYFAMELVRGKEIHLHSRELNLPLRERILLLISVCEAVQHAHQKGVIHRDLKPANILVDASSQPKILDFGVARAVDAQMQATTMHTDTGQLVGTLAYMSPEQAAGDAAHIDTRADVYSLGVIGFELLGGQLPYSLRDKSMPEAIRIICDESSAALSSVNRSLRGDIETIVGKAMQKERDRRYASAGEFAADLRRFLQHEPISARPASTWYQLSRFVRRNKILAAGVAATMFALSAGIVATSLQTSRARRAEADALSQKKEADTQREEAVRSSRVSEQVNSFLIRVLGQADPNQARGNVPSVLDAMAQADKELANTKFEDPLIEASVREAIGGIYSSYSRYDEALAHQRRALELTRGQLGADAPEAIALLAVVVRSLHESGRFDEAIALSNEAVDRTRRVYGENDENTIRARVNYASALNVAGRFAEAVTEYRQVLRLRPLDERKPELTTLALMSNLGLALCQQGKAPEAEPMLQQAYDGLRAIGGDLNTNTLSAANSLIICLDMQDKAAPSMAICKQCYDAAVKMFGEENPVSLTFGTRYALELGRDEHRHAEGFALMRKLVPLTVKTHGWDHPGAQALLVSVAHTIFRGEEVEETLALLKDAYEASDKMSSENAAQIACTYGQCLAVGGKYSTAAPVLREAVRRMTALGRAEAPEMEGVKAALADAEKLPDEPGDGSTPASEPAAAPTTVPSISPTP